MKKFITKTLFFLVPLLIMAILMELSLRAIPNNYKLKNRYLDTNSDKIKTLILGSSHSFYGLNPKYFSDNTFNASHISQSYNYDLKIFEKYATSMKSLKTIILPISYFSLFEILNSSSELWRVKNYTIYYKIKSQHPLNNYTEILSNNLDINFKRLISYYIRKKSNIFCSKLGWGTDYSSSVINDLEILGKSTAIKHTIQNHQYLSENILTLKSIIKLANNRDIKVIIFTPPAFKSYRENLDREQLNVTINSATKISEDFDNCKYINLLDNKNFLESDFFDSDHLNEIGAKKLSELINNL